MWQIIRLWVYVTISWIEVSRWSLLLFSRCSYPFPSSGYYALCDASTVRLIWPWTGSMKWSNFNCLKLAGRNSRWTEVVNRQDVGRTLTSTYRRENRHQNPTCKRNLYVDNTQQICRRTLWWDCEDDRKFSLRVLLLHITLNSKKQLTITVHKGSLHL